MLRWSPAGDSRARTLSRLLGAGWRDRLGDQRWTTRNAVAQPLIVEAGISVWQVLRELLPPPTVVAGYSIGEVAAQCVAGTIDAEVALNLACVRARCMDDAAQPEQPEQPEQPQQPGLAGVTGLIASQIDRLCGMLGLERAIRNGPESVVLGGALNHIEQAREAVEKLGGRLTRLPVSIASHTSWMAHAASQFASELDSMLFTRPAIPLLDAQANLVRSADDAKKALVRQISHEIRWDLCSEAIAARRVNCVLEAGPGCALSRMWRQLHPEVPTRSVDEFRSIQAIIAWVTDNG